jgi:hypothetical protein
MKWRLFVFLAAAVTATSAHAETAPRPYPQDVQRFTERMAMCTTTMEEHIVLPEKYWACDKLDIDRATLISRYHDRPDLIAALNGRWKMEARAIPQKSHPLVKYHLDLKGGSLVWLDNGTVLWNGKPASCKKMAQLEWEWAHPGKPAPGPFADCAMHPGRWSSPN